MEPLRTTSDDSGINSKFYVMIRRSRELSIPLIRCDHQVSNTNVKQKNIDKQKIVNESDGSLRTTFEESAINSKFYDMIRRCRELSIPLIRCDHQVSNTNVKQGNIDNQKIVNESDRSLRTTFDESAINSKFYDIMHDTRVLSIPLIKCDEY
ncbi:uncharacterized protein LOC100160723 [Acyrthosiphon pisum]|uniref:Uncharacterized protein n=1 Tax=Acyrthosiphon pisum TaxID=7029 RepID=A0A8R2A434_ACYPI|nr:uncharacterized protein LOC100160723 [Acyrthosiphon pisum]|eukprot:XP_001942695.1 PREDICTED: uncharacterized protein LOC100160723 [Acyrthosiphon pisum]